MQAFTHSGWAQCRQNSGLYSFLSLCRIRFRDSLVGSDRFKLCKASEPFLLWACIQAMEQFLHPLQFSALIIIRFINQASSVTRFKALRFSIIISFSISADSAALSLMSTCPPVSVFISSHNTCTATLLPVTNGGKPR